MQGDSKIFPVSNNNQKHFLQKSRIYLRNSRTFDKLRSFLRTFSISNKIFQFVQNLSQNSCIFNENYPFVEKSVIFNITEKCWTSLGQYFYANIVKLFKCQYWVVNVRRQQNISNSEQQQKNIFNKNHLFSTQL